MYTRLSVSSGTPSTTDIVCTFDATAFTMGVISASSVNLAALAARSERMACSMLNSRLCQRPRVKLVTFTEGYGMRTSP
jgi:hypothetical protein